MKTTHFLSVLLGGLVLWPDVSPGAIYYVATNGNDNANGTSLISPWRTVSQAAATMMAGDTVYIRGGTYRETITPARGGGSTNNRITYAAYNGEQPVISGADIYTNWTFTTTNWVMPWTTNLITGKTNLYYRREMVIVDGTVLTQVSSLNQVSNGKYYVDGPVNGSAPTHIWMRTPDSSPPSNHVVECTWRYPLFNSDLSAGYFHMIGLTFKYCANEGAGGTSALGMVTFNGQGNLVESNLFEWAGGNGLRFLGGNMTFLHNVSQNNGEEGWGGAATNCLFQDCKSFGNNWRGYDIGNEAGGGKWLKCINTTINRFESGFNNGPGIWLDFENRNNTIENCLCYSNQAAGVMLEFASTSNLVYNCIIYGTRWYSFTGSGILSQESSYNTIEDNTIINNDGAGIYVREDGTQRATNGFNRIYNNIVGYSANDPGHTNAEFVMSTSYGANLGNQIDGNLYYHPNFTKFGFGFRIGASTFINDLSGWQGFGYDLHGKLTNPLLQDWTLVNGWHLMSNSPAIGMAVTAPVTIMNDYEYDPRPLTGADSGADEYNGSLPTLIPPASHTVIDTFNDVTPVSTTLADGLKLASTHGGGVGWTGGFSPVSGDYEQSGTSVVVLKTNDQSVALANYVSGQSGPLHWSIAGSTNASQVRRAQTRHAPTLSISNTIWFSCVVTLSATNGDAGLLFNPNLDGAGTVKNGGFQGFRLGLGSAYAPGTGNGGFTNRSGSLGIGPICINTGTSFKEGDNSSITNWAAGLPGNGVVLDHAVPTNGTPGLILGCIYYDTANNNSPRMDVWYNPDVTSAAGLPAPTLTYTDTNAVLFADVTDVGFQVMRSPTALQGESMDNVKLSDEANGFNIVYLNAPLSTPDVSITSPADGVILSAPANITINADASESSGSITNVDFYQGTTWLGQSTANPYTFTWSNVTLGTYTLTAVATDNLGNSTTSSVVNVIINTNAPYGGMPWPVPGLIQAEDYDTGGEGVGYHDHDAGNQGGEYRNDDVDIKVTTDAGGGYAVGWFNAGEWLNYTVDVACNARYDLQVRVGTLYTNRTFHIEFNGTDQTGEVPVPLNSAWDTYQNVMIGGVPLSAGQQSMRLVMGTNDFMDLNWIQATPSRLPQPWQSRDIGGVGEAGSTVYSSGTFVVTGSGTDIFGGADAGQYAYQAGSGDCAIQAQVADVQNIEAGSKGGVMIRETLDASAANAAVFVTPGNGINFQWRATAGGTTFSNNVPGVAAPCWVRLVRTGNNCAGYYSGNGTDWTAISTQPVAMATDVKIGVATASQLNTTLGTATFASVSATPWTPLLRNGTLSGGQFVVEAPVLQGWTCVLQTSTNLTTWSPVLTNKATANGDLCLTNAITGLEQQQFYRVQYNP